MSMDNREFILASILYEREHVQRLPTPTKDAKGLAMARRIERAREDGSVVYKPGQWDANPLTLQDRRAIAQALRDLERDGLVEVERDSTGRPTWTRLTPSGEKPAAEICRRENIPLPAPEAERSPLERLRAFAQRMEGYIKDGTRQLAEGVEESPWATPEEKRQMLRDRIHRAERNLQVCQQAIANVEAGTEDGRSALVRILVFETSPKKDVVDVDEGPEGPKSTSTTDNPQG